MSLFTRSILVMMFVCSVATSVYAQDVVTSSDTKTTTPSADAEAVPKASGQWIDPKVVLYGSGKVASPDASPEDVAASGGFGLGYVSDRLQLHLTVHKGMSDEVGASLNADGTVKVGSPSAYGHTILDPSSASTSYLLRAFYYPWALIKWDDLRLHPRMGFGGYMMASNVTWIYPSTTEGELSKRNVTSIGIAPCFGLIGRGKAGDNLATLYANGCLSYRAIGGDIAHGTSDDLRQQLIGTKKKIYVGPEVEVGAQLGNLGISARITYFFGGDADGLSGLRFVPTVTGVIPVGFPLS